MKLLHTLSAIRSPKYPAQFTEGQQVYSARLFKSVTDLSGARAWDSAGELKENAMGYTLQLLGAVVLAVCYCVLAQTTGKPGGCV